MLELLLGAIVLVALLALPLVLLRLAFHLVSFVLFLPLKLLGLVLKIVFGVVGVVFKVLFSAVGLVAGLVAALLFLVVVPLLPFVLVGLAIWAVVRASRPSRGALRVA